MIIPVYHHNKIVIMIIQEIEEKAERIKHL